ncbi:unnamed protein product [Prunus armeniaca]
MSTSFQSSSTGHILFFHSIALVFLLYYRASFFFFQDSTKTKATTVAWLLVFVSEILLSFEWLLSQSFRWRPISRTAFPERLPGDDKLPAVDVFICTADPEKEQTVGVMNTVLSAMAMDYPPDKLHVYLSDDGWCCCDFEGAPEGLFLCRRRRMLILAAASSFKKEKILRRNMRCSRKRVREKAAVGDTRSRLGRDHPAVIELRVSGVISNSPYILGLDCDMHCHDPSSARQAMCFHLDPKISPSLALVQFPQKFQNISNNDIYDSQLRSIFSKWQGFDGVGGPCVSGTGYYIKRLSLCSNSIHEDGDPMKLRESFGPSNEFIKSLHQNNKPDMLIHRKNALLNEAQLLASCAFENGTEWGEEVGFMYGSVAEDYVTGFRLHCKGWISVYCNPPRPQFLGRGVTNLDDFLVHVTRWTSGMVDVIFSKFCPLIYGPSKTSTFVHSMCYAEMALVPIFHFLPLWCFATIPQLCLLNGISLYPEVSNSYFIVFSFIFLSLISKHLYEVLSTGFTFRHWINEQRIWMMKSVISDLYGSVDGFMKKIGMREANFFLTNKVDDVDQLKRYNMGVFDFQTSILFLAPMTALVILNMASFAVGISRVIFLGELDKFFIQIFIPFYVILMNHPIVEGMLIRKDKGRIPPSITLLSAIVSLIVYFLGSIIFM